MTIEYMREYIALAECLSFTDAANRLFISQPNLSRHISQIEHELGTPLIERSKHIVRITEQGETVLCAFKELVNKYDMMVKGLSSFQNRTPLRVGMLYYGFGIKYAIPLIEKFQQNNSNIRLETIPSQPSAMRKLLRDGKIDIGLSIFSKYVDEHEFVKIRIGTERLYAIVLNKHPLSKKESVTLDELVRETIIELRTEPELTENLRIVFRYHDIELAKSIQAEHIDTLLLTLQQSNGVFIGTKLLEYLPRNDISFVRIDSDDFNLDICFLLRKDDENPIVKEFLCCADSMRHLWVEPKIGY